MTAPRPVPATPARPRPARALLLALLAASLAAPALAADSGAAPAETAATAPATPEEVPALALTGDAEAGAKLYKKDCRGCHGPKAKGLSAYPSLVKHEGAYLIERLHRYRAGERFGPNTPLMAPRAKALSDQDIADVIAFVVSLQ